MVFDHNYLHESGSREFSDKAIRHFLLGSLGTARQPLFEQRLITDDALDARVRLAEFDLADDYVFGRLGAADQRRFEDRFLLASERQQKLHVSGALRDRSWPNAPTSVAARFRKATIAEGLHLFGLEKRAWRIAFSVLVFALLFGTAWLLIKEPRIVRQLVPRRAPARPTPSGPLEVHHPLEKSSGPSHIEPSPTMPIHEPTVLTAVLEPGASAAGVAVMLPKIRPEIVRLRLTFAGNQLAVYRAELRAIGGRSLFEAESIKPTGNGGATLEFDVPARLLEPGDYQIELTRAGDESREIVARYYFRAQIAD